MKKLLLFGLLLISGSAQAGTISVPAFSADSGVAHLNTFRTTVVNVINGNIAGSGINGSTLNIQASSLGNLDFADSVSPIVRDSELLGNGSDSVSSGTLVQTTFAVSGCVPADDTDLQSDISACTLYVNGYRVSKGATALTYTASRDNYVDLSQAGVYTVSPVTIGAAQPSVAANSGRLAKVTTDGTQITAVTDLARRTLSGLVVPTDFRNGMNVSRDSASTITVFPGTVEINSEMLSKTSTTTLNLGTAGDWAGGVSLRATSTYGFVGEDASGNIKMHTTAPTHQNYALTVTEGKKRYASWAATTYRVLGWFYMNATGSGELNTYEVGNIKEGDVANSVVLNSSTQVSSTSTTMVSDTQATARFYSSGGPVKILYDFAHVNGGSAISKFNVSVDSIGIADFERWTQPSSSNSTFLYGGNVSYQNTLSQGSHTVQGVYATDSSTTYINRRTVQITEQ